MKEDLIKSDTERLLRKNEPMFNAMEGDITQAMVHKWLRKTKHINLNVDYFKTTGKYTCYIPELLCYANDSNRYLTEFPEYSDALEMGIRVALDHLISEDRKNNRRR